MYAIAYVCPATNDTKPSYRAIEYSTVTEAERSAAARSENSGLTYLVEDKETGLIQSAWKDGNQIPTSYTRLKKAKK